jgi:hypothetical protein
MLQYADGTVLCFEHDPQKALNLKLLLYLLKIMLELNINFSKSEVFVLV